MRFMPQSGIRKHDLPNAPGMWRSPVAQRSGGPEVASSNLVIPTTTEKQSINTLLFSNNR